ncbi:hypothetical protein J2Z40_001788 [Cytobacillus eiseniae]|uniref:Uncharacterized protein n=1 Tax=Cytobacillus eiseniae TaxID=762947 RepID=A0ABS4RFQ2_9BACI|nr:hypothetical protein [Cytobacillus eiseniae]MBP2241226.1 hypothetical protein [Cytobacillus eiseniae]
MTSILSLITTVKEDLNKEDSNILHIFNRFLNGVFSLTILFGFPMMIYLIIRWGQFF